jgi:hypothetical protein
MLNPSAIPPKTRRHLSFDPLIQQIHRRAEQLPDSRKGNNVTYSVTDAVMSAIAMFSLKDPSLPAFQERRNDTNMKNIFRILQVPCDTQTREILDPLDLDLLRSIFKDVLRELQRGKALEAFDFFEGHCLLSMDGSGYYSSKKVHCKHCLLFLRLCEQNCDRTDNAIRALLRSIEIDPSQPGVHGALAAILSSQGDHEGSQKHQTQIDRLDRLFQP